MSCFDVWFCSDNYDESKITITKNYRVYILALVTPNEKNGNIKTFNFVLPEMVENDENGEVDINNLFGVPNLTLIRERMSYYRNEFDRCERMEIKNNAEYNLLLREIKRMMMINSNPSIFKESLCENNEIAVTSITTTDEKMITQLRYYVMLPSRQKSARSI